MANNNQNTNQTQNARTTSLVYNTNQLEKCISDVCIPMSMTGIVIKDTTIDLADKVVNLFVNMFEIHELEHCFFYPRKDNTGEVIDFDAVLYFNTNIGGNRQKNIYRVGSGNGGRTNDGRIDLMRLVGSRTMNGAFNVTDKFRSAFASVAASTDRDNNMVIKAVNESPHIAILECNFFRLLALVLGISSNDPFDFTVAECFPLQHGHDPNFGLVIIKEMLTGGPRRAKSGTNYSAMDNKRINSHRYR